jgi:hypothetical protein
MTQYAAAPFLLVVHVHVVKILLPVSEVRRERRLSVLDHIALVAAEAQGEGGVGVRNVNVGRKCVHQEMIVRAAVRIMTATALAVVVGPVQHRRVLGDDRIVAGHAEVLHRTQQHFLIVAGMGRMARGAPLLHGEGWMSHRRVLDFLADLRVTEKTHFLPLLSQHFRIFAAMRVVTGRAARRQGGMDVLLLDHLRHVGMATEAQLVAFLHKQLLGIRRVGGVTDCALSSRNRAVDDFEVHVVGVTGTAQLFHRLHQQLGLIR